MIGLTVHLPLVGEDDLPPSTWRVDGERLVEGLLDLGSPDTFSREVKKERIVGDFRLKLNEMLFSEDE